jgi:DNA-binding transcriptional ArsR family regulator
MTPTPSIAAVAALVGNPGRANVLVALLGGRALTATELAFAAHVSPQTTSGYLADLTDARLLVREKQGRHAYYRLTSPLVDRMLEGIMAVAVENAPDHRPRWNSDNRLRTARTCYDHLAGRLGVAIADGLVGRKEIILTDDGGQLTTRGARLLDRFGIDLPALKRHRRIFCRPCLDWSERRPHLSGSVGAALAVRCFELGWVEHLRDTRAIAISPAGQRGFAETFGIEQIDDAPSAGRALAVRRATAAVTGGRRGATS